MRVAIIACMTFPELGPSDALYARALQDLGAEVRVTPWNGPGGEPAALAAVDVAVLRCPWDYPRDASGFLDWLDGVERAGARLFNRPAVVRWNTDKRYLLDLARAGVAVPPTVEVRPDFGSEAWRAAFAAISAEDGRRAVLKPCWGGSGLAVRPTALVTAPRDWRRQSARQARAVRGCYKPFSRGSRRRARRASSSWLGASRMRSAPGLPRASSA